MKGFHIKSQKDKLFSLWSSPLRRGKKKYYNDLDLKIFDDNTKFAKRIKPLYLDKQYGVQRNITIIEHDLITTDIKEVAEKLNNFLIESVKNLEIEPFSATMDNSRIIYKYKPHPSIKAIKKTLKLENRFVFKDMTAYELEIQVSKLNCNKASMKNDIPAKMLIESKDIISSYLSNIYNNSKNDYKYPISLKVADVTSLPKREEKNITKEV